MPTQPPTIFATTSLLAHSATSKWDPVFWEVILLHNNILGVNLSHAAHFPSRDIEARQSISKRMPNSCCEYSSVCNAFWTEERRWWIECERWGGQGMKFISWSVVDIEGDEKLNCIQLSSFSRQSTERSSSEGNPANGGPLSNAKRRITGTACGKTSKIFTGTRN